MTDTAARLRALVIMDEVMSDNPLGRDAADENDELRIAVVDARACQETAEADNERLRAEVERYRTALEKTTALAHANLRIQAGELTGEIMQVSINAREIFEEARAALEDGK